MKRDCSPLLSPHPRSITGNHPHVWEHNTKMELHEVGWGRMTWIVLAQNREKWRVLMNAVMNLRVP